MTATELYLVMASSGEYSDRVEWPVAVYAERIAAERHVLAASTRWKEIEAARIAKRGDGWFAIEGR